MKETRKIYDRAFKEKAVLMSYERRIKCNLAYELGISKTQLYNWRKEYKKFGKGSFPGNGNRKKTTEELYLAEYENKLREIE